MKTLDEVIEALNNCADVNANFEACECCEYRDIRDDGYDCGRLQMMEDALHYLKEFKRISARLEKIALGNITETLEKLDNPALTWDELKQMEGKPVWVEVDEKYKGWVMVGKFYSLFENEDLDAHVDLYYFGRSMEYSKEMYGYYWQAYRKERS